MPLWLQLFLTFFKIGAFTFGGGYAMLGIITENCVEKKKWITGEDMMNVTIIAETTPGPVAINAASFVGYRTAGFWGAVVATLGVVLPSFIIIYLISLFLEGFLEIVWVANAFKGIKIAVGFLVVQAGFKLLKQLQRNAMGISLLCIAFGLMLATDLFELPLSSIMLMAGGAVVGLVAYMTRRGGQKK